jgi:hypothetical protein
MKPTAFKHLFDLADDPGNEVTLPADVRRARNAHAYLIDARVELGRPTNYLGALDTLIADVVDAAADGRPLPDVAAIQQAAKAETQAIEDRRGVINQAIDHASELLDMAIRDNASRIITEHLRPHHDQIVAELTQAVAVIAKYPTVLDAFKATARDQKLYASALELRAQYRAVRAAWEAVSRVGPPVEHDISGEFAMVRNVNEVWTEGRAQNVGRPWPDGDAGLDWLVTHGAQLWLPTAAERDARWLEVHELAGQRIQAAQAERERALAMRGVAAYGPKDDARFPSRNRRERAMERLTGSPTP